MALVSGHPAIWALAVIGVAARQHALAILAHQSAHYRMYRTRWLNDLVGRLCALPLGVSVVTYRVIHRLHHNHLYEEIDPDLPLMAGYPRGRAYLARKLLKDLCGLTTIKNDRRRSVEQVLVLLADPELKSYLAKVRGLVT